MTAFPFVALWLTFSESMVRASCANFTTPTREPTNVSAGICTIAQGDTLRTLGSFAWQSRAPRRVP